MGRVRALQSQLSAEDKRKALDVVAKRLGGNVDPDLDDPRREIRRELLTQIQTQRARWAGRVIRRTNASVDNNGNSVMRGLPPLTIVTALVTLSDPEIAQITDHAEEVSRVYVVLTRSQTDCSLVLQAQGRSGSGFPGNGTYSSP